MSKDFTTAKVSEDFTTHSLEDRSSSSQKAEHEPQRLPQEISLGGSKERSSEEYSSHQSINQSPPPPSVSASHPSESDSKDITSQEGRVLLDIIRDISRDFSLRLQLLECRSLTNPKQDYIRRRMVERRHIKWSDVASDDEGNRLFKGERSDFYHHVRRVVFIHGWKEVPLRGRRLAWAVDDLAVEELKAKDLLVPNRGRIKTTEIGPDEIEEYFNDVRTGPAGGLLVYRWLDKHHSDWGDDRRDKFLELCGKRSLADGEFEQVQEFHNRGCIRLPKFKLKEARSKR